MENDLRCIIESTDWIASLKNFFQLYSTFDILTVMYPDHVCTDAVIWIDDEIIFYPDYDFIESCPAQLPTLVRLIYNLVEKTICLCGIDEIDQQIRFHLVEHDSLYELLYIVRRINGLSHDEAIEDMEERQEYILQETHEFIVGLHDHLKGICR